jgi:CRISPR/Cas system-associated exonuclease Cas4 (RecB family)
MLEINTINEFLSLPTNVRDEIQKAIRTKDRLENFLLSMNKRSGQQIKPSEQGGWEQCPKCLPTGYPGWVYKEAGRDDSDIHPSQINKCLKFLYYSCAGYTSHMEEIIDSRLRMIFDLGHAWHNVVQRYGQMGAWGDPKHYRKEVAIDPDAVTHDGHPILPIAHQFWLRGHVDGILDRYEIPNVPGVGDVAIRIVHEYKTINDGQYKKLTRPKPEHKYQATIYSAVFDIPLVVYLYVNKDNCYLADFPVPFDHTIWNEIVAKCYRVQYYVESNMPPPWEETSAVLNPAECENCAFRKLCSPPRR